MSAFATIMSLLTPLRELLESVRGARRQRDEEMQDALAAVYVALSETLIYLRPPFHPPPDPAIVDPPDEKKLTIDPFVGAGGAPVRPRRGEAEAEARLSRLWMAAAVKLHKIDPDLARRCELKGEYWAMPEEWGGARLRRARIEIGQMRRAVRELL